MPTIRKLTTEEIAERNAPRIGQRQQIAQEYDALMAGFVPGEWGEIELSEDDSRLTVQNRLKAAAQRRQLHLAFQRTSGNVMRFTVEAAQAEAPAVAEVLPKRRGRKPRVVVS